MIVRFENIAALFDLFKKIDICSYIDKKLKSNNYTSFENILWDILEQNIDEENYKAFYFSYLDSNIKTFEEIDVASFVEYIMHLLDEFAKALLLFRKKDSEMPKTEDIPLEKQVRNILLFLKDSTEFYNTFEIRFHLMKTYQDFSYCETILKMNIADGFLYYAETLKKVADEKQEKTLWELWLHKEQKRSWQEFSKKYKFLKKSDEFTYEKQDAKEKKIYENIDKLEKKAKFKKVNVETFLKNQVK